MKVTPTSLPGVVLIEPRVFRDDRGYFLETFSAARYAPEGLPTEFAQDNASCSKPGVLRGLHYQFPIGQGKLVGVAMGEVFDVAVDIRVGSPTFGQWTGETLSSETGRQLYIPPGFAHGFLVTSDSPAVFSYKCTASYDPNGQCSILWNDPDLAIDWPGESQLLSPKDAEAPRLRDVPESRLPRYS
jgi:dTDP-4-dehydrorhamnose 3,5-epimerase